MHIIKVAGGWFSYTLSHVLYCYPKKRKDLKNRQGTLLPTVFSLGEGPITKNFIFNYFGVRLEGAKYFVKKALLVLKKGVTISLDHKHRRNCSESQEVIF